MKKLMALLAVAAFVAGCATLPARTAKSKCLCSPACVCAEKCSPASCGETCKCGVKGEACQSCQPAAPGNCGGSCAR